MLWTGHRNNNAQRRLGEMSALASDIDP